MLRAFWESAQGWREHRGQRGQGLERAGVREGSVQSVWGQPTRAKFTDENMERWG